MTFDFKHAVLRWLAPLALVGVLAVDATAQKPSDVTTERKPSVNDRVVPESVDDLKALQEQVKKVVAKFLYSQ